LSYYLTGIFCHGIFLQGYLGLGIFLRGYFDRDILTCHPPIYMEQLKLKADCMSFKERKCVILLDEMAIKKYIEYNKTLDEVKVLKILGH